MFEERGEKGRNEIIPKKDRYAALFLPESVVLEKKKLILFKFSSNQLSKHQNCPIMSKRRGVSAQEKRDRLLTMLRVSLRPWSTKEIEKSAKSLGFHAMAIPDVLSGLLDDNLAIKEKIGSANYVWSFPSDAYKKAKTKHDTFSTEVEKLTAEIAAQNKMKQELEPGRERTSEYNEMYDDLKTKRAELKELNKTAQENAANDPEAIKDLDIMVQEIRTNVNRVTDNTFELQSYLVKKKNMDRKAVKDFLHISDSYDNI